jgi:hypothetical protein
MLAAALCRNRAAAPALPLAVRASSSFSLVMQEDFLLFMLLPRFSLSPHCSFESFFV